MTDRRMTKSERDDLVRLVKQRERVAKTAAQQRSLAMVAEFEQSMNAVHRWATNDVMKATSDVIKEAAMKAAAEIEKQAEQLGIPMEFRPRITVNVMRETERVLQYRRDEMRRLAKAEIAALEQVARVQIEQASVQAQTEIVANGLDSAAAIAFLEKLPPIDTMMPVLDVTRIQAKLAERARESSSYRGPHLIE